MRVLGINEGKCVSGKNLYDGGVCLIENGEVKLAISEERISRVKREGGFHKSLSYILESLSISYDDIDLVVSSSCCEKVRQISGEHDGVKKIFVNHHLSHAYGAFYTSGFDNALILVLDSGGNTFSTTDSPEWWAQHREQQSYYLADSNGITLIDKDCNTPFEAGIGEVYRAFTYFLGWSSSRHAGKTMALAAYGDIKSFHNKSIFFLDKDGHICSRIKNNPLNPVSMIEELLNSYGLDGYKPRNPEDPIRREHKDLACWIQTEIENIIEKKVRFLVDKTGVKNLCFSGGVAYNCKMLGYLIRAGVCNDLHVSPASGDQGQCLGNAIYGYEYLTKDLPISQYLTPYLGKRHNTDEKYLQSLSDAMCADLKVTKFDNVERFIGGAIAKGYVIAIYDGESEFGPRALGNRSILASPQLPNLKKRLNNIKDRELFQPFATAINEEWYPRSFYDKASLYMSIAVKAKPFIIQNFPELVHKDNTSRVQIVSRKSNPRFYRVIDEFREFTDIPMLINTSFNGRDEPIVESPKDAFESFINLDLDFLFVGNCCIQKNNRLCKKELFYYKWLDEPTKELLGLYDLSHLTEKLPSNINYDVRSRFLLYKEYSDWVLQGKKITTIRFRPGKVDLPSKDVLPLYITKDFSNEYESDPAYHVRVSKVVIKKFGELTTHDAKSDGFETRQELIAALSTIYRGIKEEDNVTIHYITPIY